MSEKKRINGLIVKRNEKAPEWVITSASIKVDDFKKWLDENHNNGWVNLDFKKSQEGKIYADVNEWKPKETVPF